MCFFNLNGSELIGLASSLSIFLSQGLSATQIGSLAAFFTSLGDNLALLATTKIDSSS